MLELRLHETQEQSIVTHCDIKSGVWKSVQSDSEYLQRTILESTLLQYSEQCSQHFVTHVVILDLVTWSHKHCSDSALCSSHTRGTDT